MKKLLLIISVMIFCQITASSQPCLPEGITFETQAEIDNFQTNHPNCTEIEGYVGISGDDITNLYGLNVLTSIGGYFWITGNASLTSLTGLDNLASIGGHLYIGSNVTLTSLTGLDNVSSIGEYLVILDNDALTSLTGLDNVTSIGRYLWIENNYALTNLTGLDNIDAASIDSLFIFDNTSLSTCEIQSICDYLASPTGTIVISNNAPGCNNQEEVEEDCEDFSIEEQFTGNYLSLFPNPAEHEVNISIDDGREINEVSIYNLTGQILMQGRPVNNIIDISGLQAGMYVVEVTIENFKLREKLYILTD